MKKLLLASLLTASSLFAMSQTHVKISHDGDSLFAGANLEDKDIRVDIGIRQYSSDTKTSDFLAIYGGGFFTKEMENNTSIYYGMRVGIEKNDTDTGVRLAPTGGYEYAINESFSVGAEISPYFTTINDTIGIDTEITLRYYFELDKIMKKK